MDAARLTLWILYAALVCTMIYGIIGGRGWRKILWVLAAMGAAVLVFWLILDVFERIWA